MSKGKALRVFIKGNGADGGSPLTSGLQNGLNFDMKNKAVVSVWAYPLHFEAIAYRTIGSIQ